MQINILPLKLFGKSGLAAQLYVLIYVLIMFSGNTFISYIVPYLIILQVIILASMLCFNKLGNNTIFNFNDKLLFFIVLIFAFAIAGQLSFAYSKTIAIVYIKRYFYLSFLLLLLPDVNMAYTAIKLSKYYSLLVAFSIILFTFATGSKAGGLVGDYQAAGMMMSIACILYLIDYFSHPRQIIDIVGFLICLTALLMSGKRMFLIIVIFSFFIIYFLSQGRGKTLKLTGIVFTAVVAILLLYIAVPQAREVFNRFTALSGDTDEFSSGRTVLWGKAVEIFKEHKLYGIGFGSFSVYFEKHYHIPGIEAYLTHNIYYGLLAETGIIGFIIYVVFMLISLFKTLGIFKAVKKAENTMIYYIYVYSLMIQLWFIIYGVTGNGIYDANETFFYITGIAIMLSVKNYLIENNLITVKSHYKKINVKL